MSEKRGTRPTIIARDMTMIPLQRKMVLTHPWHPPAWHPPAWHPPAWRPLACHPRVRHPA
jgi:hypothetical protein